MVGRNARRLEGSMHILWKQYCLSMGLCHDEIVELEVFVFKTSVGPWRAVVQDVRSDKRKDVGVI